MIFDIIKLKKLIIITIMVIGLLLFLYLQNNMLTTTNITVQSNKLPKAFDGYTIVHLSDLHGKSFGKDQETLVKKIKAVQPDLIVFTGDLIDSRRYYEEHSITLMREITKIAPVYYVAGNHEGRSGKFDGLEKALLDTGVKVLRNTYETIIEEQEGIYIIGIDDPVLYYLESYQDNSIKNIIGEAIEGTPKEDGFKILLSHRPEMFSLYSKCDIDLIFSGHAHGGQIRLPFIGGLIAPHQGVFPKYTSGKYIKNSSVMIVSRGLGNSIFPQRLCNRPEIIVVKLMN